MITVDRKDVEDIILGMADIVMENRELRYENIRLREAQGRYYNFVDDLVKGSEKANKEFLKMILENSLMGGKRE